MKTRLVLSAVLCTTLCLVITLVALAEKSQAAPPVRTYNTAKAKLMAGKAVVGGTVSTSDPNIYCAMANAGFDFTWIEMQHSPLMFSEVAKMIWACRGAGAIPFIRVPDATEGAIQKATDIGALGIVVPMVATADKARDAVKYAKYPPLGRRSRGGGQYGRLWGSDYRETANDNIMVVVMIESPLGVSNVAEIAAVPGVDVVFAASGDLGSFTGWERTDSRYVAMVKKIHDATLKAGKILAGPLDWKGRDGFMFFQGPSEGSLIRGGAASALGAAPPAQGGDHATGDEPTP